MGKDAKVDVDAILAANEGVAGIAVSMRTDRGIYTFSNEVWSELAEVTIHKMMGKSDGQLPWGPENEQLIRYMDAATKRAGFLQRVDRLAHFSKKLWLHTATERIHVPDKQAIICIVKPSVEDKFCQLANQVTDKGITVSGLSLSIKQLWLLQQLFFHVPHKQTAKELGCSVNRVNQYFKEIRDKFEVDDTKELMCALSAHGLFPLVEHLDMLFRRQWVSPELKHH